MKMVQISNIHASTMTSVDSIGQFSIAGKEGELIEFRSLGYEVQRLRVPKGRMPNNIVVQMRPAVERMEKYAFLSQAQRDSIEVRDAFTRALAMPKLHGYQIIQSPFSALSKRNRQIWAFQDDFEYTEQQKYVDRVFNPALIARLTNISQDSIATYAAYSRPSYEQLLVMNEYEFYSYIQRSAEAWQRRERARRVGQRVGN